ncbi:Retrovirus-related Pol polyprotein from type-1 retrotransposable element R2 [Stylophora pistillata]|uniref:Retrovirus-related Pol polyprotein from type-1 retrotransposable element R2 n=1 Tax=Stylophora pistillata TaxID=50429 RepID=A0A2B4RPP8_STYPI|nr:Retrovirus-related Pol polyprotein from type-1 retrotransposable element R2 [Stylophora pistillata]
MEGAQRGAHAGCSGIVDNLLTDRKVTVDCHWRKRNLSMGWLDVKKAYDSIDHGWLEMMLMHRFPTWLCLAIQNLSRSWSTRIVTTTRKWREVSDTIRFRKGLPQGDALCPRLFTVCLNPIAWKISVSEGYRLSEPIESKVRDLLYIDELKIFASSESGLSCVMKSVKTALEDVGLQWNPKKCAVVHLKWRTPVTDSAGLKVDGNAKISSLEDGKQDKFLGVLESLKQEEKLALQSAAKEYLQRLSGIWSIPLSYFHRGGNKGGRGLHSTQTEYKETKVRAAVNLYQNRDPAMKMVRDFEEHAESVGRQALTKEVAAYAREYGLQLQLEYPDPVCVTEEGEVIPGKKVKNLLKRHRESRIREEIREQRWHGKLVMERERDEELSAERCFWWMGDWRTCPTLTIAGMFELYEQLLPTRFYTIHKTRVSDSSDSGCRLCGTAPEGIAHILSDCPCLHKPSTLQEMMPS